MHVQSVVFQISLQDCPLTISSFVDCARSNDRLILCLLFLMITHKQSRTNRDAWPLSEIREAMNIRWNHSSYFTAARRLRMKFIGPPLPSSDINILRRYLPSTSFINIHYQYSTPIFITNALRCNIFSCPCTLHSLIGAVRR
jgi:hypothetical protein